MSPRAIKECAWAPQQWDTEHVAMAADCTGFEEKVEHGDIWALTPAKLVND